MILILILSDAKYNFDIRFVAMIHFLKTCIGPKTILSVESSVGPKSVDPIISPLPPLRVYGVQTQSSVQIIMYKTAVRIHRLTRREF